MGKWKNHIAAIMQQKSEIESGALPASFIERTIDARIESDCVVAEKKTQEYDGGDIDTDFIEMTDDRRKWNRYRHG